MPWNLHQWPSNSHFFALAVGSLHYRAIWCLLLSGSKYNVMQGLSNTLWPAWVQWGAFCSSQRISWFFWSQWSSAAHFSGAGISLSTLNFQWSYRQCIVFFAVLVDFYTRLCGLCPCPRFSFSKVLKLCPTWTTLASSCTSGKCLLGVIPSTEVQEKLFLRYFILL